MNPRHKRWLVIALLVSAVLSPFVFFSSPLSTWQNPPATIIILQDITYPFERAFHLLRTGLAGALENYFALSDASRENQVLRRELAALQTRIMDYEEQVLENTRLRKLLSFAERSERKLIAAEVVSHSSHSQFESIRISRGEHDGIRVGMPAVAADGVVGKVIRTGAMFADVQLLTDPDFHIDVLIQRARVRGILAGDAGTACNLKLHKRVEVRIGDTLVTSGIVGGFPKGLPVGRVTRITYETENVAQSILVEPWVDYRRLEEVMVILSPDQELEGILETAGPEWLDKTIGRDDRG